MRLDEFPNHRMLALGQTGTAGVFTPATREADGFPASWSSPPGVHADLADEQGTRWVRLREQRSGLRYFFGWWYRLDKIEDRAGARISFAYNQDGYDAQLASVTDSQGRVFDFSYDDAGSETKIAGPAGRSWHFGYTSGYLSSYTDPTGAVTYYGYDSSGRLDAVQDPRGNTTRIGYDDHDRVAWIADPAGNCQAGSTVG
jgi:YD repeat-containing protein